MMKLVTYGSCESEYVGLSEAGNEAVYLNQLQGEMRIGKPNVLLLGDNECSLKLAMNPVFHQRSKHIRIKCVRGLDRSFDVSKVIRHFLFLWVQFSMHAR